MSNKPIPPPRGLVTREPHLQQNLDPRLVDRNPHPTVVKCESCGRDVILLDVCKCGAAAIGGKIVR
jgi:hypothetical protein